MAATSSARNQHQGKTLGDLLPEEVDLDSPNLFAELIHEITLPARRPRGSLTIVAGPLIDLPPPRLTLQNAVRAWRTLFIKFIVCATPKSWPQSLFKCILNRTFRGTSWFRNSGIDSASERIDPHDCYGRTPKATRLPLPTPADRPQADILIYDGHCRICRAQVERLCRWDSRKSLAFLSLHDPQGRQPISRLELRRADAANGARRPTGESPSGGRGGPLSVAADTPAVASRARPAPAGLASPLAVVLSPRRQLARIRLGGRVDCDDGTCSVHFKP